MPLLLLCFCSIRLLEKWPKNSTSDIAHTHKDTHTHQQPMLLSHVYRDIKHWTISFILFSSCVFIYCILHIAHSNRSNTVHCIFATLFCTPPVFINWILDIVHCNKSTAVHIILNVCVIHTYIQIAFGLLMVLFGLLTGFILSFVISCFKLFSYLCTWHFLRHC